MEVTPSGKQIPGYLLDAYIDALKEALLLKRRRYRPELRKTEKHDALWRRAALFLIDQECDPFRYIEWAFAQFISKHDDVYPGMVTADWCLSKFVQEAPSHEHELGLRVKLAAEHVKFRIQKGATLEEVLTDPSAPLSPVFRFALAWSEKRYELAERLREDAQEALFFEPGYKKILSAWLPEEWRK